MEQIGIDLNSTGSVLSKEELNELRKKKGECMNCGQKCFQKKLFKFIPLTIHGKVLNGRCLRCNPLTDDDEIEGQATMVRPATQTDLERFSRSQSTLFGPSGSRSGRSLGATSSVHSTRTVSSTTSGESLGATSGSALGGMRGAASTRNVIRRPNRPQMTSVGRSTPVGISRSFHEGPVSRSTPDSGATPPISQSFHEGTSVSRPAATAAAASTASTTAATKNPASAAAFPSRKFVDRLSNERTLDRMERSFSALETNYKTHEAFHQSMPAEKFSKFCFEGASSCHGALPAADNFATISERSELEQSSTSIALRGQEQDDNKPLAKPSVAGAGADGSSSRQPVGRPSINSLECSLHLDELEGSESNISFTDESTTPADNHHQGANEYHHHNQTKSPKQQQFIKQQIQQKQLSQEQITISKNQLDRAVECGDYLQIVDILRDASDSSYIILECFKHLSSFYLSEEQLDALIQYQNPHSGPGGGGADNRDAIEIIIDAMSLYPSEMELQIYGIRTVWNTTGTNASQIRYVEVGALDIILSNMDRYRDDVDIQECIVGTISNLAAAESILPILMERHVVQRVVECMNNHSGYREVFIKGCSTIANMASHLALPSMYKKEIMDLGGGGAVVVCMVMHPDDVEIQEIGLKAIRNLASNNEENKLSFAHIGGIDAVISAMQVHRDVANVQESGAWALANLSSSFNSNGAANNGNVSNNVIIGDCGGIDVIIRAMWVHSETISVLEWCCRALYMLTLDMNNRSIVLEVGGISAIINSMQAHVDSSPVQEMGCGTLANLARGSITNDGSNNSTASKIRIVDEEALDAIVLAMVLLADNSKVQERACEVILELAIIENFKSMLASNVRQLVLTAAENFPNIPPIQEMATRLLDLFEVYAAEAQAQAEHAGI